MAKSTKSRSKSGCMKGERWIKKASKCMNKCSKPQYRMKKSPYYCKSPMKSFKYPRCKNGYRRKGVSCVPVHKLK